MIHELKVMRGPNAWSNLHHRLIVIKLENIQDEKLNVQDLCSRLADLFPPLHKAIHETKACSETIPKQATVARLLALTGLELQILNTPGLFYCDSHLLGQSSFYSVFEYRNEEHGRFAATIASNIMKAIISGEDYHSMPEDLKHLKDLASRHIDGPSTAAILNEARSRNIPVAKIANGKYALLGHGKHQHKIEASISDATGMIAVNMAGNKSLTKQMLADAMLPVPQGVVITSEEELEDTVKKLGYPLVTKPLDGHQGKCITTDITKFETLQEGFKIAKSYSRSVIVEKYIKGNDYRFLVVNYKLVAAARRSPALVKGDGVLTIRELIEKTNKDPLRGKGHNSVLTRIDVDEITEKLIAIDNRTLDTVLKEGEIQVLKDTANLSTGGTAVDVTDDVHPDNIRFAERAARIIGLDICGLDIMATDITKPLAENGGAIIEANAAPGLRMHIAPSAGKPREVGKAIIDMLFPGNNNGRIPVVAITGTNGKTTTSRLMAHVAQHLGFCTGLTATEGIYINGQQVVSGDCSGPKSTAVILQDPMVDFAVLECARGGIIRSGLAFDQCDIGIVTNVAADHLGLKDIYTVEDMARVKEVIPQSVKKNGYAILNASLDLVFDMSKRVRCNVALFSLDEKNKHVVEHCKNGGLAAVKDAEGNIVILHGDKRIVVEQVKKIPITMQGRAGFMIENVLPVVLASYISEFPIEKIKEALASFHPTEEQAPGRLNVFDVNGRHVMIDYAHNPHSIQAFAELMHNIPEHKTGIITGVGDRRDEDIIEVGVLAAQIYDDIIIRVDDDTRDRMPEEIIQLVERGIKKEKPDKHYRVIPEMKEALEYAIEHSEPGSYIILNAELVSKSIQMVKELKKVYETLVK
ncbi:MAG: cyanophycin synthetase [Bacteroidetes bacterium]|nr:cyanophycin synthetase [Bacteroidota bacterium]